MKAIENERSVKVAAIIRDAIPCSDTSADPIHPGSCSVDDVVALAYGISAVLMKTGLPADQLAKRVIGSMDSPDDIDAGRRIETALRSGTADSIGLMGDTRIDIQPDGIFTVGIVMPNGRLEPSSEQFLVSQTMPKIVNLGKGHSCSPTAMKRYVDHVVGVCMASRASTGHTAKELAAIMRKDTFSTSHIVHLVFPLKTDTYQKWETMPLDPVQMEHRLPQNALAGMEGLIASAEKLIEQATRTQERLLPFIAHLNSRFLEAGIPSRIRFGAGGGLKVPLVMDGYGPRLMLQNILIATMGNNEDEKRVVEEKFAQTILREQAMRHARCGRLLAHAAENVDLSKWDVDMPLMMMLQQADIDVASFLRETIAGGQGRISAVHFKRFGLDDSFKSVEMTPLDGRLRCRMALSKGITWSMDTLVLRGMALPSTVLTSLKGMPLSKLITHPLLGDGIVISSITAARSNAGETYTITMKNAVICGEPEHLDMAA